MANYKWINGKMVKVDERQEDSLTLQFKEFYRFAKKTNKAISLMYDDQAAKYDILLDDDTYKAGVAPDDVLAEIKKLGAALKKRGPIRFKEIKVGNDADGKLDAELFVNNKEKVYKLISVVPTQGGYFICYIPADWREILADVADAEDEDEDYDD